MAGQTVGNQTPHLSSADEPELKHLLVTNMSNTIKQGWHWKRNEQLLRTLVILIFYKVLSSSRKVQ